eukprot:scaffold16549_cov117-Isochrysis_galbana.AAC.1
MKMTERRSRPARPQSPLHWVLLKSVFKPSSSVEDTRYSKWRPRPKAQKLFAGPCVLDTASGRLRDAAAPRRSKRRKARSWLTIFTNR